MAKLVKLTDEVGAELELRAKNDHTSLAGEVKLLLDGKDNSSLDARLTNMAAWLQEQFDSLRSLIEDTTVDRIATTTRRVSHDIQRWDWEEVKNLYFDLPESSPAWYPKVYDMWGQSSAMDMFNFVSDGETLYSEFEGVKTPLVHLTPEVLSILGGSDVAQS